MSKHFYEYKLLYEDKFGIQHPVRFKMTPSFKRISFECKDGDGLGLPIKTVSYIELARVEYNPQDPVWINIVRASKATHILGDVRLRSENSYNIIELVGIMKKSGLFVKQVANDGGELSKTREASASTTTTTTTATTANITATLAGFTTPSNVASNAAAASNNGASATRSPMQASQRGEVEFYYKGVTHTVALLVSPTELGFANDRTGNVILRFAKERMAGAAAMMLGDNRLQVSLPSGKSFVLRGAAQELQAVLAWFGVAHDTGAGPEKDEEMERDKRDQQSEQSGGHVLSSHSAVSTVKLIRHSGVINRQKEGVSGLCVSGSTTQHTEEGGGVLSLSNQLQTEVVQRNKRARQEERQEQEQEQDHEHVHQHLQSPGSADTNTVSLSIRDLDAEYQRRSPPGPIAKAAKTTTATTAVLADRQSGARAASVVVGCRDTENDRNAHTQPLPASLVSLVSSVPPVSPADIPSQRGIVLEICCGQCNNRQSVVLTPRMILSAPGGRLSISLPKDKKTSDVGVFKAANDGETLCGEAQACHKSPNTMLEALAGDEHSSRQGNNKRVEEKREQQPQSCSEITVIRPPANRKKEQEHQGDDVAVEACEWNMGEDRERTTSETSDDEEDVFAEHTGHSGQSSSSSNSSRGHRRQSGESGTEEATDGSQRHPLSNESQSSPRVLHVDMSAANSSGENILVVSKSDKVADNRETLKIKKETKETQREVPHTTTQIKPLGITTPNTLNTNTNTNTSNITSNTPSTSNTTTINTIPVSLMLIGLQAGTSVIVLDIGRPTATQTTERHIHVEVSTTKLVIDDVEEIDMNDILKVTAGREQPDVAAALGPKDINSVLVVELRSGRRLVLKFFVALITKKWQMILSSVIDKLRTQE